MGDPPGHGAVPGSHASAPAATYDAFVSYSRRDGEWVRGTLMPRLRSASLRACIDEVDFRPGAPSVTEIERFVLASRHTLLVLSPNYLSGEWTVFESILAHTLDPASRARRVLPLMLTRCELPLRIRALTYLDFTREAGADDQFARLVAAIRPGP